MALATTTVWEVRTAGSDTLCSGGFVAGGGGTDYSQQDAAQYTGTDLVIDAVTNTKVTSAGHNFVAADVGNLMQITAGTGYTTGFYQIASVASNAATLDRAPGAVGLTGGTYAVGGALKSPALAVGGANNQNIIWVKSGAYTISSTTAGIANGVISLGTRQVLRGYQTTRGDDAARPVLTASGIATITLVTIGQYCLAWNIEVGGASLTAIKGFAVTGAQSRAYFCVARNCTNNGFDSNGGGGNVVVRCYATGCSTQYAFSGRGLFYCEANANTGGGFIVEVNQAIVGCLAYGNTGIGFNQSQANMVGCTAYNNSTVGFSSSDYNSTLVNCVAYGNGTYGFDGGSSGVIVGYTMWNCAGGANTTANRNTLPAPSIDTSFITLTADPFVNKAGGNFGLNTTAGGGAALRAAGIPGLFAGATTTGYLDIGAVQTLQGGSGPNVITSSGAVSRGGSW